MMKRTFHLAVTTLAVVLGQAVFGLAEDTLPKTGEKQDTLLYVRTIPPGAKVLLDGKELGTSDGVFHVEPGVAAIVVELEGHKSSTKKVTIRSEGITRVELKLKLEGKNGTRAEADKPAANENPSQLTQQGWRLWQEQQWDEAIVKFRQAVQLDSKNEAAWNGLGWASFNSGKRREAENAFTRLIKLNPNHPAALNGLGQLYLAERKYDQAEKYLLKAASQRASAAWYGLARLYLLQGKYEQAEKYAQMIVDSGQGDNGVEPMLKAAKEKQLPEGLRMMIEPQPMNDDAPDGSFTVFKPQVAADGQRTQQQAKAHERMKQDANNFSADERREIESLYQIANQKWQTQEARDSLKTLVEKYKKANRTGCAILYLGQMTSGDEQLAYLRQAIAEHGDCFYGDGVQVGSFARFLLGNIYRKNGNDVLANPLFDEIRKRYPDAVDHHGKPLVEQLPQDETPKDTTESSPLAKNILKNPSCETGDSTPDNWEQGAAIAGVRYSWNKKIGADGKASLCIEKTVNRYFPIAQWSQTVDRQGDATTLEVSSQVKAKRMTKAIIDVIFLDKDGQWISHEWVAYIGSKEDRQPPANHDWKPYSGKVAIPPGTAKLCIALQVYGPGTAWFDDVQARYGK